MALSLDDRILGEKVDNYCSSSEDEGRGDDSGDEGDGGSTGAKGKSEPTFIPEAQVAQYDGRATNTGPKGVLNDWREFKRLETEQRESQEQEKQQLLKKLSMTCRSHLDDDKEKKEDEKFLEQLSELEDEFMKEYRQKRIEEMRKALDDTPKFGYLLHLEKKDFIDAIDKEKPQVKIIVHIFEDDVEACEAMNGCLSCLAKEYSTIKFCRIKASDARMSHKFSANGVPALLIYKGGELIGNFVRVSDEFGEDFYATDVESYLQEHGILPHNHPTTIRDPTTGEIRGALPEDEEADSDFDVD